MANQYGLFWNSESGDRVYDADSLAEWLQHFFTNGVFEGELYTTSSGSMDISISKGYANINGKVRMFDSVTALTLEAANPLYPRIDNVVVERNNTNREITLKVVTGTYSGSTATPVGPTRTEAIYQLVIARIQVDAGATQITQANITDTRMDKDLCGYVSGTVSEIDYSQISAQFSAYLEEFKANNLTAFEEWFATIQGILGKDEAAKLLALIQTNQTNISTLETTTTDLGTRTIALETNTSNLDTRATVLETNTSNLDTRATVLETKVGNYSLWVGTQSEYNAIATKDANTIYHILES